MNYSPLKKTKKTFFKKKIHFRCLSFANKIVFATVLIFFFSTFSFSQNQPESISVFNLSENESLIKQYVKSKGPNIIVFDSSNIKQFWVDTSVVSKNGSINVVLSSFEGKHKSTSLPFKIINVNETQDCHIEVLSEATDLSFDVVSGSKRIIASSEYNCDYLTYHSFLSSFHLEDTSNLSFSLVFNSRQTSIVPIKTIIMSFSKNNTGSFLSSPGTYNFTNDELVPNSANTEVLKEENSVIAKGNRIELWSTKKILVSDNPINSTLKVKNIGDVALTVYVGYAPYTVNNVRLRPHHYPPKDSSTLLRVIASKDNSSSLVLDSYDKNAVSCFLAIDAKDDFSDIPNLNITDGTVLEIKTIDDSKYEYVLSKPIKKALKVGTVLRPHKSGGAIYTATKQLLPREEFTSSATIVFDEKTLNYSKNAFPKGTYYVRPIILSYPVDSKESGTIQIIEYSMRF